MADIYIYSSLHLREARGNLEDDLNDFLGDSGEVTGGGGGERGWNVNLEVADESLTEHIAKLKDFLVGWGVPPDAFFDVIEMRDREEHTTRHDVFDTSEVISWVDRTLTFLAERYEGNPGGWQAVKGCDPGKLADLEAYLR